MMNDKNICTYKGRCSIIDRDKDSDKDEDRKGTRAIWKYRYSI